MVDGEGVEEFICKGGSGSEATVLVELRKKFPGMGGDIFTQEGAVVAMRVEKNFSPGYGHRMFVKHMLVKKLEDYFYKLGRYNYAHLPRPFGSIDEDERQAYIYEWVFGKEGFPWRAKDYEGEKKLTINEWNEFVGCFASVGIAMNTDCSDPEDCRISKNIIHQFPEQGYPHTFQMSSIWKRIDFGPSSLRIDYDSVERFLIDNERKVKDTLRLERYNMLTLALDYLKEDRKMSDFDKGRLEILVGQYRRRTLQHYTSRTSGLEGGTYFC